ncbi:MAG: site-2 protease family protein, partial [Pseudomonadota bacterium]
STSIGLLNLFPIPILDGGHLVFYAAEALRGKPLGERWMNAAMAVGLSLVLLLMGFATYNDLSRL